MAGETVVTVVGNLTGEPELKYTPSGAAVASFTVVNTPRKFDKATDTWVDGDPLFLRCSVWRDAAEHVTESLAKRARVIVQGRLKQRSFETKDGEKRTVVELDVDEVGPSLRYATAKVQKVERSAAGAVASTATNASGGADPWATAPAAAGGPDDTPPF